MPQREQRLYRNWLNGSSGANGRNLYEVFAPALRDESYRRGMHYDNGLLTEDDIAEVEQLAQAYYDVLDAEDKADQELKENVKIGA